MAMDNSLCTDERGRDTGSGPDRAPFDFRKAFAFSLETMTTIGFSLPDDHHDFFEGCWSLPIIVHFQVHHALGPSPDPTPVATGFTTSPTMERYPRCNVTHGGTLPTMRASSHGCWMKRLLDEMAAG
jgi:hypothetical protein